MADSIAGIDYDKARTITGLDYRKPVPRNERKLRRENITDFKTGLLNERGLTKELERQILHAKRTGENLTVVFIDADKFKNLNSKYEYHGGDTVLKLIAKAMNDELRNDDSKGRWGGDEFLALMSREHRKKSPEIGSLKSNLPPEINPEDVSVTLVHIDWNGETPDEFLRQVRRHILDHKSSND